MNNLLLEFAGRMADSGATRLPESFGELKTNARFHLGTRMSTEPGPSLPKVNDYRLNLKKGRLTLMTEDGGNFITDAQIVGTLSNDGSWMWGWGHPEVPEMMQAAAWAVRQFGERQEIEELMTRGGPTDPERVGDYHAICAYISNADGVFVGDHGGGGKVAVCYYLADQLKVLGE